MKKESKKAKHETEKVRQHDGNKQEIQYSK